MQYACGCYGDMNGMSLQRLGYKEIPRQLDDFAPPLSNPMQVGAKKNVIHKTI